MQHISGGNRQVSRLSGIYRSIFPTIIRHPASWIFAVLYVGGCMIYALDTGLDSLIEPLAFLACYALIVLAVLACTANAPAVAWEQTAPYSRRFLIWQCIAILCFYLLDIGYTFLLFGYLEPHFSGYGGLFVLANLLVLFLIIVALPLLVMRLLRVRWSEMGLGRGYRVWLVMGISCAIPVIVLIIQMIMGRSAADIGRDSASYLLQAAIGEEIFYRGLMLTRLIRLTGTIWAIVLAALLFGLSHAALDFFHQGNLLITFAQMILAQATFGIVVAVIFIRSRNIWAGVVFHALADATNL